jgi:hypothetical protein
MSVPTATLCLAGQVSPNVNAKITADIRFIFFTQIYIPDPDLSAGNQEDSQCFSFSFIVRFILS